MTACCRFCDSSHADVEYDAAFPDPGPKALAIGRARHRLTGLEGLGHAMQDDDGKWRCVTCLEVVPPERIVGAFGRNIDVIRLVTGYERLCCGTDGTAHAGEAAEVEE